MLIKNSIYKCFLDLDNILLNNSFLEYNEIKANLYTEQPDVVCLNFIKGINLCKYIVEYISNNYETYLDDTELSYKCDNFYNSVGLGNFSKRANIKYHFNNVAKDFSNILIRPSNFTDYIKKNEPLTVWVPTNINNKEKLIKYLGWEPNIIE